MKVYVFALVQISNLKHSHDVLKIFKYAKKQIIEYARTCIHLKPESVPSLSCIENALKYQKTAKYAFNRLYSFVQYSTRVDSNQIDRKYISRFCKGNRV